MKLFSGSAHKRLAEKVAERLNLSVSPLDIHIFPDGEKRVRVAESVVNEDCIVIQPTSTPANDNYMELFFIVDAIKRSGAKTVTVVIPYLGYQRQDHVFRDGEAVSLEVIVRTLEAVGVDKVIAYDLHSIKIPEVFKVPITHLSALDLFAHRIKQEKIDNENNILITPDMGGIRRIKILSELLGGMPYGTIEKNRDLVTGGVEAKDLTVPENMKDLTGKTAYIVDDMISSGGTIVKAVELLKSNGVAKIFVFATHAVFSANAPTALQDAPIEKVIVTDTVFITPEKRFPKLEILTIADAIAEELKS